MEKNSSTDVCHILKNHNNNSIIINIANIPSNLSQPWHYSCYLNQHKKWFNENPDEEDVMATTLQTRRSESPINVPSEGLRTWTEQVSEYFWFLLSLVLFIVLGPFSGPIALIVLSKLGLEDSAHAEPESIVIRN